MTTAFLIYCATGCSCCNNENHYRGPFSTREIAEEKKADYTASRLLASQYSENGNYTIYEVSCEQLPDGRLIIDGERLVAEFADEGDDYYARDRF